MTEQNTPMLSLSLDVPSPAAPEAAEPVNSIQETAPAPAEAEVEVVSEPESPKVEAKKTKSKSQSKKKRS